MLLFLLLVRVDFTDNNLLPAITLTSHIDCIIQTVIEYYKSYISILLIWGLKKMSKVMVKFGVEANFK